MSLAPDNPAAQIRAVVTARDAEGQPEGWRSSVGLSGPREVDCAAAGPIIYGTGHLGG